MPTLPVLHDVGLFQGEELSAARRRAEFLNGELDSARAHAAGLAQHQARLEEQLKEAGLRNAAYEGGVYGLPQVSGVATAVGQV
jgi:hypothetical protein